MTLRDSINLTNQHGQLYPFLVKKLQAQPNSLYYISVMLTTMYHAFVRPINALVYTCYKWYHLDQLDLPPKGYLKLHPGSNHLFKNVLVECYSS